VKTRKKLLLGAAALGALAAGAIVWWWLASGAEVKAFHAGAFGWHCDPNFTIVESHPRKVVVRRVGPEGELQTLGSHPQDDARHAAVTPGIATFYAISTIGWGPPVECRVYDAGEELYTVPLHLLAVGPRSLAPVAVLIEGRLLTTYQDMGGPLDPPTEQEVRHVAILAREGERLTARQLVPASEQCLGLAVSGDGTTVAVALGPSRGPQQVVSRTLVYSAKDLKPLCMIEGLRVQAMSNDGSLVVGRKGDGLAVYRDGQLLAERADRKPYYLRLSWDGAFLFLTIESQVAEVLDTKSLKTVYQARAELGMTVAACAVSSSGRLALVEQTSRGTTETVRSELRVYGKDSSAVFTRRLGETASSCVRALHWTRDGKVLYYLFGEEGRVVRCPVP